VVGAKIQKIWLVVLLTLSVTACGVPESSIEVKTAREAAAANCDATGKCIKDPSGLVLYNSSLVTENFVLKRQNENQTLLTKLFNLIDEPKLLVTVEKLEPLMRGVAIVGEFEPCDSPKGIDGSNPTAGQLRSLKQGRYKACITYIGDGLFKRAYALSPIDVDTTPPDVSKTVLNNPAVTPTTASLSWSKAGDNLTLDDKLIYSFYTSKTKELNSLEAALTYGRLAPDLLVGGTNYTISSLSESTDYQAAVVVTDEAGNQSLVGSTNFQTTASDTIPPSSPSISINAAATYANTTAVTLTLSAGEASEMYVTDADGCASGGAWETYDTSKSWTLTQTNATATVYAKFRDLVGNETACVSDTIIHDDIAPTAPNVIGATPTSDTTPTWSWTSGGGNGTFRYKLGDANLSSGATENSSLEFTPASALSEGTYTLYVQELDAAGNWSTNGSLAIQVVTPPAAPTLSIPTRKVTSLELSWASVAGATSYNLYWSTTAGVTTGSTKISNFASVYTHTPLTGGTTYYYKLAAVKSGIEGELSNEVSAAPYSYAAPTVTAISPNVGSTDGITAVTITGTGFVSGATISIGGVSATGVMFSSATALRAITPAGSLGAHNVLVTNPDGQAYTLVAGYTYKTACSGDCYLEGSSPGFAQDLDIGIERLGPSGTTLTLQYADDSSEWFKIWKEKGGDRILNSTGLVGNGWQKQLTRAGIGFTETDFTAASSIEGRVCPPHVFFSHSNMTAAGRCLYYDTGNMSQRLDAACPSGNCTSPLVANEASDWLQHWDREATGRGTASSYYEGNIKTCADKGMRLPTAYETSMTQPTSGLPTGDIGVNPIWAFDNGVPHFMISPISRSITASALTSNSNAYSAGRWTSHFSSSFSFASSTVRCVLPATYIIPESPVSVMGTPGDSKVSLTWTAPAGSGSEITDYVTQYSSNYGSTWTTFDDGVSTTTSVVVTGLTNHQDYRFRVAAVNTIGTGPFTTTGVIELNFGILKTCSNSVSADRSNDCYNEGFAPNYAQDFHVGTERQGPGGTVMTLVNGASGFKVWKEKDGIRILNATGLIANGWQKQLTRAGISFIETDFTAVSGTAGRVCPTHVFLSYGDMTAQNRCLYYDLGNAAQTLYAACPSGNCTSPLVADEASDWLQGWDRDATGRGSASSYYEGNIKTCADKGMRLPTAYETNMMQPTLGLPTGDIGLNPIWAGDNGVPHYGGQTWTASAGFFWQGPGSWGLGTSSATVRCVLP
jgi:hypothetical protein